MIIVLNLSSIDFFHKKNDSFQVKEYIFMIHSASNFSKSFQMLSGRGGENRTPIKSFGDSYATIIPRP